MTDPNEVSVGGEIHMASNLVSISILNCMCLRAHQKS